MARRRSRFVTLLVMSGALMFILTFQGCSDNNNPVTTVTEIAVIPGADYITADAEGNVFVANHFDYEIYKINVEGAFLFIDLQASYPNSNPKGIAADANGNLYVAANNLNKIIQITPVGVPGTIEQNFSDPINVAVDADGENIYVRNNEDNSINRFIRSTNSLSTLDEGSKYDDDFAHGLATDADGNVYAIVINGSAITKIYQHGNQPTTDLVSNFGVLCGVAVHPNGSVFTVDREDGNIYRITQEGSISIIADDFEFSKLYGIAIDSKGIIYVTENDTGKVYKIVIK